MEANGNNAVRYRIEPRQSQFVVQAFAEGMLSVFGHNPSMAIRGFGGDARCVPGTLEQASVLMLVQSDSLAVIGQVSEKDRLEIERMMRADVLEIARYPEIVFMSTSVSASPVAAGQFEARIAGSLSLHGVTREHRTNARVTVDGNSLRARGEFGLRQSDYNIKPVSVMGGTLKVKDDLKFSFDIHAIAE
ncbi:MAG TPA: YceI family protein [Pyrinomonadaceae bacterium]|jgi:polyisoprenoid-binding protein YceI|nr:YceI family protein [Pyrinomonadaceae bacterium]